MKLPQKEIFSLLSQTEGLFGVYIEDIESGEKLEINSNHIFPCASVIKIPLLATLLSSCESLSFSLDDKRKIATQNRVSGTGILSTLEEYYEPTIDTLAKLMITLSDNSATNEIIDIVGLDRVKEFLYNHSYNDTKLMRKMMDFEAIKKGLNNFMSAKDAGRMLSEIARGVFINESISTYIFEAMCAQQYRNKLPSLLPAMPFYATAEARNNIPENSVLVANKTGDLPLLQHDVGIFELPSGKKYVIAVFSEKLKSDEEGIGIVAKISRAVYDAMLSS